MTLDALLVLTVLTVGFLALLITCYGLVLAAVRLDTRSLTGLSLLLLLVALIAAGSTGIRL